MRQITCDGYVAEHAAAEVLYLTGGVVVRHGPQQVTLTLIVHGVV